MTTSIGRRLDALEQAEEPSERIRLIIRRLINPEFPDAEPTHVEPSTYLPAVDRLAGESWGDFVQRLLGMVERLPRAPVVRVIARSAVSSNASSSLAQ